MNGRLAIARLLIAALLSTAWPATAVRAETAKPLAPLGTAPATKAAPLATEEPRDVVATIYRLAATDLKKAGSRSPFFDRAVREKYFSKSFDLLVTSAETKAAHDGDAVLDFDPISASSDAESQKVTLKTDVLELGKATVSASFANHGEPTVVTYDFVRQDDSWKVNDVKGTTNKEAWSVRKILASSGRAPTELPGQKDATAKGGDKGGEEGPASKTR